MLPALDLLREMQLCRVLSRSSPWDAIDSISALCPRAAPPFRLPPGGVLWYSDVLGETIRLVPDGPVPGLQTHGPKTDQEKIDRDGRVIYRPREIAALQGLSFGALCFCREVREAFPGLLEE